MRLRPVHLGGDPVVLDCEGLSRLVSHDVEMRAVMEMAWQSGSPVVVSAATIVESIHARVRRDALHWTLSKITVAPVTRAIALSAGDLLTQARRHGHAHALDAILCATALSLPARTLIFTSDPGDIRALIGDRASVVPLR